MATKLIVGLTCIALVYSNPVYIKDYIFRDGRGFAIGQAQSNGFGQATGSATVNNEGSNAFSQASSNNYYPPGQNSEVSPYSAQYGSAQAVAQAQSVPAYYSLPFPAAVVSYEQNFGTPQLYGVESRAESTSVIDHNSGKTITSSKTEGSGSAQSTGIGSYGITSSNANSFGSGSALSTSNNIGGLGSTSSRSQGFGSATSVSQNALGLSSSSSQTFGGLGSASSSNTLNSIAATANAQGLGSASSNAYNNGANVIAEKPKNQRKSGWQLGTSYNIPTPSHVQAVSQSFGGSATSNAYQNGVGNNIKTSADTQGQGLALSNAGNGNGFANSVANSNGYGAAKSATNINGGSIKSDASTNGIGFAQSYAAQSINQDDKNVTAPKTNPSSQSNILSINPNGFRYYSEAAANSRASGLGAASSAARTQGVDAVYNVADSSSSVVGSGAAQANAYTLQ